MHTSSRPLGQPRVARLPHARRLLRQPLLVALVVLALSAQATGCTDNADSAAQGGGTEAGADNQSTAGSTSGGGLGKQQSGGADASAAQQGSSSGGGASSGGGGADDDKPKDPAPGEGAKTGDKDKSPTCNKTDDTVLYLSADDSNSMAGAQIARGLIAQGQHVYKALRTYEFLNYYSFDYAPAKPGHVAVTAQMRESKGGAFHLQIGVQAPLVADAARRKAHIVLAVDTSSSMGWGQVGDTGIDRAIAACMAIGGSLGKGDLLSVVTWGGEAKVKLNTHKVASSNDTTVNAACQSLGAEGLTNLGGGLAEAYKLASAAFDSKRINRVVLVSDGGTNVGDKDKDVIAKAAKDADGEAIYLMGVGVGDPWNYNDDLMDTVTDAGKGAYVFLDSGKEAANVFGTAFLRHIELSARNVQVEVTLPPTFAMDVFHGEQWSTNKDEVQPQHLAVNDAMIFHQVLQSCDTSAIGKDAAIKVKATWKDPVSGKDMVDSFEAKLADLLQGDHKLLRKGDAVVAYVEALKSLRQLTADKALQRIDEAIDELDAGLKVLAGDKDLVGLKDLLLAHKEVYKKGQLDMYPSGGTGAKPIGASCTCDGVGDTLAHMSCALGLCSGDVLLSQSYTSSTGSTTKGSYAAAKHFGAASNDLAPREGGSYALMATGPALGTKHSEDMGGSAKTDPFAGGSMFNAMEWKLHLKAPAGANGLRLNHVFFSQEYDEYVGSKFNDKFYIVLEAGSTNGGKPTVINYTKCRDPDKHHDFVCSPGMQFCNPRQRYCYIAINTAASECCWLNGCPNGKAKTDIGGTGFTCAASKSSDSAHHGSSTGWMVTEWPIEPGEVFTLTFHVHDTGDGIYDSEIILDNLQFVHSVTPGTWPMTM